MKDIDELANELVEASREALAKMPPGPSPERRLCESTLRAAFEYLYGLHAEPTMPPPWRDGSDHLDEGEGT